MSTTRRIAALSPEKRALLTERLARRIEHSDTRTADVATRLTAFVIPASPDSGIDIDALRNALRERLPDYMTPSEFHAVSEFPISPNGKIDRAALAKQAPRNSARIEISSTTYSDPVSQRHGTLESNLASIWKRILRIDSDFGNASFFDLGGHSLLATRLLLEVEKELGIRLSISSFFENPTLPGMAKTIRGSALQRLRKVWKQRDPANSQNEIFAFLDRWNGDLADLLRWTEEIEASPDNAIEQTASPAAPTIKPTITRQADTTPIALSFGQQRLWTLIQLEGDSAAYNMPISLRIRGSLNDDAFAAALQEIVARHDSLRQKIGTLNGKPRVELADTHIATTRFELNKLEGDDLKISIQRHIEAESRESFDLAHAPPFRVRWLDMGPEDRLILITYHHIAFDGWSMQVYARELSLLYQAFRDGLPSPLPTLPLKYSDYAAWQRNWLAGSSLSTQLDYWKRQLADAPEQLNLPTDFTRPPEPSYRGRTVHGALSSELTQALHSLAREEGATLFMVMLAAYQILLSRVSGQTDICVGTPVANRQLPETESMIGLFVNTLVMRGNAQPEFSARAFLQATKQTALDAYANQDAPFEKVVDLTGAKRSLSRHPLFQAMLLYQGAADTSIELAGANVEYTVLDSGTAKFDLTLGVEETASGVRIALEYATDLFSESTAQSLLKRFTGLLETIVSEPDVTLGRIPILLPSERQAWIDFNATDRPASNEGSLLERFAKQVKALPTEMAVAFQGTSLSFEELDRRSNQLARVLIERFGAKADERIGLCLERTPDLVVGLIGILKSGAAYVPIDPNFPHERIRYMIEDSGIDVLVTQSERATHYEDFSIPMLCLDDDHAFEKIPEEAVEIATKSSDLAYVIYTSGSTGQPKGVMIERGSLDLFLEDMIERLNRSSFERILGLTTISFDIAALEMFLPLALGKRLDLLSRDEARDATALRARLESTEPTLAQATPATWRMLAATGWQASPNLTVLVGGEAFPRELIDSLSSARAVWNVYGPTEATIWATAHLANSPSSTPELIGKPLANYRAYVVNSSGEPNPPGTPGELWLAGEALARGYFNRPELTAERFGEVEILGRRERIYRTGDLARWRQDGNLEFLGRIDRQIKLRGFRIELGEIETALGKHPQVEAAIVDLAARGSNETLVAFIVFKNRLSEPTTSLRAWLATSLPDYMIPSTFVPIDAVPLTANGKIDRRALVAPEPPPTRQQSVAHVGGRAGQLLEIWKTTLGNPDVGLSDDFFEIGGDSLLAIQVVAEARQAGLDISVADIFRQSKIEQWIATFGDAHSDTGESDGPLRKRTLTLEDLTEWAIVIPIKPTGSKPPIFMIHDITSSVLIFRTLAHYLPDDQPLYALQSPTAPYTCLEAQAERYISEIKKVLPSGRFVLGGYCFGGGVAFEMARQLAARGEEPPLIVMIDGIVPDLFRYMPDFRSKAKYLAKILTSDSPRRFIKRIASKIHRKLANNSLMNTESDEIRPNSFGDPFAMKDWPETAQNYTRAHSIAVSRYRPKPHRGDMLLFRSRQPEKMPPPHNWNRYVKGQIEVVYIDADHDTIVATQGLKQIAPVLSDRVAAL